MRKTHLSVLKESASQLVALAIIDTQSTMCSNGESTGALLNYGQLRSL